MSTKITELDQMYSVFEARFNARDVDGLLALFMPDGVFIPGPGAEPVKGEGIRAALEGLMSFNLPISVRTRHVYAVGNVALAIGDWKIEGTAPDGTAILLTGTPTDVLEYSEEHGWRVAIDNPFGTALSGDAHGN